VAVAVAGPQVGPGVELLPVLLLHHRQRTDRLVQDGQLARVDGRLPGARAHRHAADADEIAEVEEGEGLVARLPDLVFTEVDLDLPARVLEVGEGRLPHRPQREDAPAEGDGGLGLAGDPLVEPLQELPRRVRAREVVRVGVDAQLAQPVELRQTGLDEFGTQRSLLVWSETRRLRERRSVDEPRGSLKRTA